MNGAFGGGGGAGGVEDGGGRRRIDLGQRRADIVTFGQSLDDRGQSPAARAGGDGDPGEFGLGEAVGGAGFTQQPGDLGHLEAAADGHGDETGHEAGGEQDRRLRRVVIEDRDFGAGLVAGGEEVVGEVSRGAVELEVSQ